MSDKAKKIFLLLTVVGSFVIYSVIYYIGVFKRAPFQFDEFRSISFKYGTRDSLLNSYNSATGDYQYLNRKDSLIKEHLVLTRNELLYLHNKASELGLWDFPSVEENNDTADLKGAKPPRYIIEFNYKRKSKKVIFDANYQGPQKLVDANRDLITEIQKVLTEAQDKQKK